MLCVLTCPNVCATGTPWSTISLVTTSYFKMTYIMKPTFLSSHSLEKLSDARELMTTGVF